MLAERKHMVDRAAPLATLEQLKAQVEAYRVEPLVGLGKGALAPCPPSCLF